MNPYKNNRQAFFREYFDYPSRFEVAVRETHPNARVIGILEIISGKILRRFKTKMPMLIEHIDKISRNKGRDVLFIIFDKKVFPGWEYETWKARNDLMEWFQDNSIKTIPCADIAREGGFESYRGQLYIDIPYIENHPDYLKVREHLENSDGGSRIPGVVFCYLDLELAMKNKHHDEPGFWEKLADSL